MLLCLVFVLDFCSHLPFLPQLMSDWLYDTKGSGRSGCEWFWKENKWMHFVPKDKFKLGTMRNFCKGDFHLSLRTWTKRQMMKRFHREWTIWRWTQLTWINAFPGKVLGSPEFRWQSSTTGGVRGAGGLQSRSLGYLCPHPRLSALSNHLRTWLPP